MFQGLPDIHESPFLIASEADRIVPSSLWNATTGSPFVNAPSIVISLLAMV